MAMAEVVLTGPERHARIVRVAKIGAAALALCLILFVARYGFSWKALLHSNYPPHLFEMGQRYEELGRVEEARALYNQALRRVEALALSGDDWATLHNCLARIEHIEGPDEGQEDDSEVIFNPPSDALGKELDAQFHTFALLEGRRYMFVARVPGLAELATRPLLGVSFSPDDNAIVSAAPLRFHDLPNWIQTPVVMTRGAQGGKVQLFAPPGEDIPQPLSMDWFTCIPVSGNYVQNGSFESLESRPSGWFVHKLPGLEVAKDDTTYREGLQSLKVDVTAAINLAIHHRISPPTQSRYRLTGWIRTENLTSRHGARLEVQDATRGWKSFTVYTQSVRDTSDWTQVSVEFDLPKRVPRISILLRRPSDPEDTPSEGRVWFDGIYLRRI